MASQHAVLMRTRPQVLGCGTVKKERVEKAEKYSLGDSGGYVENFVQPRGCLPHRFGRARFMIRYANMHLTAPHYHLQGIPATRFCAPGLCNVSSEM
jgi:hypothetical protein